MHFTSYLNEEWSIEAIVELVWVVYPSIQAIGSLGIVSAWIEVFFVSGETVARVLNVGVAQSMCAQESHYA